MVSSIGSMMTDLLQNYREMQFSSGATKNESSQSFEEIIGNKTQEQTETVASEKNSLQAALKSEDSDSSGSAKNEMDLNQDGVVTIDEVMQYVSMQMSQELQEQLAADQGSDEMSQNADQSAQQQKADLQDFKSLQATQAYQKGENLLSASIGAVTQSFAV